MRSLFFVTADIRCLASIGARAAAVVAADAALSLPVGDHVELLPDVRFYRKGRALAARAPLTQVVRCPSSVMSHFGRGPIDGLGDRG